MAVNKHEKPESAPLSVGTGTIIGHQQVPIKFQPMEIIDLIQELKDQLNSVEHKLDRVIKYVEEDNIFEDG